MLIPCEMVPQRHAASLACWTPAPGGTTTHANREPRGSNVHGNPNRSQPRSLIRGCRAIVYEYCPNTIIIDWSTIVIDDIVFYNGI